MEASVPPSVFDSAYETQSAPWVIGEPQPAIVDLERHGWIRGAVLDLGCGSGEHTIHLCRLGYQVRGLDSSARAVELARANADAHEVTASFEVADALNLTAHVGPATVDTVVDSALFHVFGTEDHTTYVRSLHAVVRQGGRVHVLALSDAEDGIGPRISDSVIRAAFGSGWEVEELRPSRYRGIVGAEDAERLRLPVGEAADVAAWLARIRRV